MHSAVYFMDYLCHFVCLSLLGSNLTVFAVRILRAADETNKKILISCIRCSTLNHFFRPSTRAAVVGIIHIGNCDRKRSFMGAQIDLFVLHIAADGKNEFICKFRA